MELVIVSRTSSGSLRWSKSTHWRHQRRQPTLSSPSMRQLGIQSPNKRNNKGELRNQCLRQVGEVEDDENQYNYYNFHKLNVKWTSPSQHFWNRKKANLPSKYNCTSVASTMISDPWSTKYSHLYRLEIKPRHRITSRGTNSHWKIESHQICSGVRAWGILN